MTTASSINYILHEESQWSFIRPSFISTVDKCWGLSGRVKRLPTSWSPGSACCNCSLQCISQGGPWHRSAHCSCTLKKEERRPAYFSWIFGVSDRCWWIWRTSHQETLGLGHPATVQCSFRVLPSQIVCPRGLTINSGGCVRLSGFIFLRNSDHSSTCI